MKQLATTSTALAAVLIVAGCGFSGGGDRPANGDSGSDGGGSAGGGAVVFAESFAPRAGWAMGSDDAFILSRTGCVETLIRYSATGEMVPSLATEWEQSEPTAWDFTLREANFQDGAPLTAEAVVGALGNVIDSETPPRSFNHDTVASIEAVDEHTVRISTPAEDPLLPERLTTPTTGILAPAAYQSDPPSPVGTCTGPFEITSLDGDAAMSMVANDDYWGGEVGLDSAEVRFIIDGGTRVTQLRTGEVDMAANLPAVSLGQLDGDATVSVETFELPRTTGIYLNNARPPFDNEAVRRAVRLALDLDGVVAAVYEGQGVPAVGPFAPSAPWAPSGAEVVPQDVAQAEAILADSGIDPATLDFELVAYNDRPEFEALAEVIQEQLAALGITVTIRGGEYASVEPDLLDGNFDATLLSRNALTDLPDPGGMIRSDYTCDGGFNLSQYCDEEFDALIAEAVHTADPEARDALYGQVAEHLQEHAISIYLVHEVNSYGVSATLSGFEADPLGQYALTAELTRD